MTNQITLRAGAAKADISPAKGIQVAGDIGRLRPCTSVKEPIYARALVLEQQGCRSEFGRVKLEFAILRRIEFVV